MATFEIGNGIVVTGTFSSIDWSNGAYFLKTETDPSGGTSYSITGTSELISVPYALYSNHAAVADSVVNTTSSSGSRAYLYIRKKATLQNLPSGSNENIINYDIIDTLDFGFNNATGTITFNQDGVYLITGHNSFEPWDTGRKIIWFNCVSAYHPARIASNEQDDTALRITTSIVARFNAGDQISFGAFQGTGTAIYCPNTTQLFDEISVNIERLY